MILAEFESKEVADIDKMYKAVADKRRVSLYTKASPSSTIYLGTCDTVKELTYLLFINKNAMSSIQKVNYITKIIKNIEILTIATEMDYIDILVDKVYNLQVEVEGKIKEEIESNDIN